MKIPEHILKVYNEVEKIMAPHKVYLVGGCIRDIALGKEPKDLDFATPATPEKIEEKVKASINSQGDKRKAYMTGARFGTIGCKVGKELVEITTFRVEQYERDSRKPNVTFITDLSKDLSRRDFTINAMAWNKEAGLIDQHGGINDLETKCIKAVGQPKERFKDDPLRILRVGRFASQLGFKIDEYTEKKATECSFMLYKVSKERWCTEFDKTLVSENPTHGLDFFMRTRVLNYLIPELALQNNYDQNSKYHDFPLWEHTKKVVNNTPPDLFLRWSALLHDIGKPFAAKLNKKSGYTNFVFHERIGAEIVLKYALYLKWSNEQKNKVIDIVYRHLKDDCILRPYDDIGHKLPEKITKEKNND